MRILMLGAIALALASAFALYGINYDTGLMEQRVRAQERSVLQARGDIAVLKAERAHLGRPARIEPLARAQGLGPATDRQLTASPAEALASALAQTRSRSARAAQGD